MAVDLTLAPETVGLIIDKARTIEAEIEKDLEHEPDLEPVPVGANDHHAHASLVEEEAEDPTEQELRDLIGDLNVDESAELIAIAWIGRGDYEAADWDEALKEARSRAGGRGSRVSRYLLGMPLLADYLETGLDALDGVDAE